MEREKKTESPMLKLARFIVDKRKAFYLIFLASFLFCAVSISKVHVNDDITTYLQLGEQIAEQLPLVVEMGIKCGAVDHVLSDRAAQELCLQLSRPAFRDAAPEVDPQIAARFYIGAVLALIRFDRGYDSALQDSCQDNIHL